MTSAELDTLWFQAQHEAIKANEDFTRYRFAAIVAAAEREACAKVAEAAVCDIHLPTGVRIYGSKAAKAIRARSKT